MLAIKVSAGAKAEWHRLAILATARDFYRGDGRGACRRIVERMIRNETLRARTDLARMGQDPDAILARHGTAPLPDPESDTAYGRADWIVSDPQ